MSGNPDHRGCTYEIVFCEIICFDSLPSGCLESLYMNWTIIYLDVKGQIHDVMGQGHGRVCEV